MKPVARAVVRLLAQGHSMGRAAQMLGINRSTARRHAQTPEARQHLAELLDQLDALAIQDARLRRLAPLLPSTQQSHTRAQGTAPRAARKHGRKKA